MIKRMTANLALWLMTMGIASFMLVYALVGQTAMIEIAADLLLGVEIMLFISYLPAALWAIVNGSQNRGDVMLIGLCAGGFFGAIRQIWTIIYRAFERPAYMLDHWSYPLIIYSCFWAVGVIVLAPGTESGKIPIPNKIHLVIGMAIGALVAGMAIGYSFAVNTPV